MQVCIDACRVLFPEKLGIIVFQRARGKRQSRR